MDYCLGAGDGTASFWTADPDLDLDGDGEFDSVRMDFDGDGLVDDALADLDGDGVGDHVALDLDDDATPEAHYTDDGTGTWTVGGPSDTRELRWFGLDGGSHGAAETTDVDGDGLADRLFDVDHDGLADRAVIIGQGGPAVGYADTDGDGRWDMKFTDTDGDGAADEATPL